MTISRVAVIGAGQMGRGIAQVFATAGKTVVIYDISQAIVDASKAALEQGFAKQISRGKMTQEDADAILSRITFSADTEYTDAVDDVDIVVEAAVERVDLKKSIFKKLDSATKDDCILATNTSSISISHTGLWRPPFLLKSELTGIMLRSSLLSQMTSSVLTPFFRASVILTVKGV